MGRPKTQTPCRQCGAEYHSSGLCKRCYLDSRKAIKNAARRLKYATEEQNREALRAAAASYYHQNKDRVLVKKRAARGTEHHKANRRAHSRATAARLRANRLAWRQRNYWRISGYRLLRRNLEQRAAGSFTAEEWQDRQSEYGWLCGCCGEAKKLTADHIVPLTKGGTDWIWNIQPLCGPCNASKGARHSTYYPPKVF